MAGGAPARRFSCRAVSTAGLRNLKAALCDDALLADCAMYAEPYAALHSKVA